MADKRVTDLPSASEVHDSDLFLLEQSGVAKKLPGEIFRQYAHDIAGADFNAQNHLILILKDGTQVDAGVFPAGPGTGDMLASTYDPAGGRKQVAFKSDMFTALVVKDGLLCAVYNG